ncbi:MAG: carboxypeptidase-like regulatory domain-containing protein, partial [Acidobacteriota bacterium]|nr:carboxypeptidase-like regulatory domain-containing protein [Acidobacteriota bacterium]
MKKRFALITVIIFAVFSFAYYRTAESKRFNSPTIQPENFSEIKAQNVRAVAFGVSGKVSDFAPALPGDGESGKRSADEQARAVPNKEPFRKQIPNVVHDSDAAAANFSDAPMPSPTLTFDGVSSSDNAAAYGFRVVPPDPNGDVGPNHYVQSVNILTRVFDKNGAALTPPFKLSSIFSTLGTPCSQRNDGDPIVLYDALADRWMISQFCNNFPPFRQLIAVSKTGDPTGAYYVYEFVMPNVKFNDYPKLGAWTDGYYMSTDEFLGSDYAGSGVFAFDKKKMLAGDPTASYIYFDLASPNTMRIGGLLPSDLDGLNAPPANAPNTFVGYAATEYGDPNDALRLFDFRADFANPNNSTFTERAESPIIVAPFDPTSPDGRADVAQPAPGEPLDAQSDRLMYRAAYRNFGTHQSLVVNQTVRLSPVGQTYRGGVRLYELRRTNAAFAVHEQSTIGTVDASRWIGSAAQDYQGNLAVGYSFSSEVRKPSILYSGKLAAETAFRDEGTLANGTGVQAAFGSRWGDYSSISIDPTDDCTFWLTNEYYTEASQAESPFGWLTRIGRFKFAECASAPRATINGTVTNAANGQAIADATVTANTVYTRNTNASGSYSNLILVPNTYILTASRRGFRSQTVTVTIINGQTLTQNFALQPTALFENPAVNFLNESCAPNNAVDPSETVTVNIGLQNAGAGATTNLTVTLLPSGGVMNPSQPQNYGALPTGSEITLRPFTFTASPDLECGAVINLTFQLQDGAENLGTMKISLNTGKQRVAFQENFDSVTEPNLPAGWTAAASGAQEVWKTSDDAFQTPPNSAYSKAASQVGVNELVSPVFRTNSAAAELTFRNRYDLETTFLRNKLYDGAVLEIKIGNDFFQDILAAGGTFLAGGYDGAIDGCCQNPLAGRLGWSGKSGPNQTPEFVTAKVKLPARAARKNVQLRWRVGTDNGTAREGQFIDNVFVSDG